MEDFIPDFIVGATNVYRTQYYIVKQKAEVLYGKHKQRLLCSRDTFYFRTDERDIAYLCFYGNRKHIDGKRISFPMYSKKYIY